MKTKYAKLRKKIIREYKALGIFADQLGIARQTISNKLSGRRGLTADEMESIAFLLDIPPSEFCDYFFPDVFSYHEPPKGRYANG